MVAFATLAACSGATPSTTVSLTVPATTPPSAQLPDGEMFAWVKGLTGDGLLIDPAEILTGTEAVAAAVEDGVIEEGDTLDTDFYIRDVNDVTSLMAAAPEATYSLLLFTEGTPTPTEVGVEEFTEALEGANPDVYGVVEGIIPATVTIRDGMVTDVAQFYLP